MSDYATEDDLLGETAEDGAQDLVLSNGRTVRVRGLTRAEHLWVGKGTDDPAEMEARMVSKGLLVPPLTLAKVKQWQQTGRISTISEISDRIGVLSGVGEGADKSDLPAVRDEP